MRVLKNFALALAAGAVVLGGASVASADTDADGFAFGSPGVLSGNVIQVPIHIPINACGNSIGLISVLNPAIGNACANS
ncbi:chaplin [Streptomyces sp. NBC_01167]|uniref:chaplin n=1 Tax=Streptomyces sp. NBC_01167 TaxID=2903756 RepID=UPI0038657E29|nr:chaplin [Streptomyces sp. NBC_01167]